MDKASIKRARNLLADSIMTEILHKNPQDHAGFKDSIHHHIVLFCQCLRVTLVILDKLMTVYNTSVANGKKHSS